LHLGFGSGNLAGCSRVQQPFQGGLRLLDIGAGCCDDGRILLGIEAVEPGLGRSQVCLRCGNILGARFLGELEQMGLGGPQTRLAGGDLLWAGAGFQFCQIRLGALEGSLCLRYCGPRRRILQCD
jgi:hypothetical protein